MCVMEICLSANFNLMWQFGMAYQCPVQYMADLSGCVQQIFAVIIVQTGQSILSKFTAV